jgi:hypothetical protein
LLALFKEGGNSQRLHGKTYVELGLDRKATGVDTELLKQRLDSELAANTMPKFVVTGERLHRFDDSTPRIRDYFRQYFDDIRIIVYVREPVSWATSRTQHTVATGKGSLHSIYDLNSRQWSRILPSYRQELEPYINLYGRDKVDIRIFDPRRFVGGSLIRDFSAAIGEPALGEELPEEIRNVSLCYEAVLLTSEFQRAMAARGEEIQRKGFKKLQRRLKKKLPGTKFNLPASIAAEVRARVVDDVAWLHDTVQENVFGTPPRGEEPAWADMVLKEVSKIISKQGSGAEGESAEKAAWADVIEALGLQFAAGRRGRVLLSRKPLEPEAAQSSQVAVLGA